MIIETLLNVLYNVFSALTSAISIPQLPADVSDYMTDALEYISSGMKLVAYFTPFKYLLVLFGIIVAVEVGLKLYHFVMWVLKKIPMIGIS